MSHAPDPHVAHAPEPKPAAPAKAPQTVSPEINIFAHTDFRNAKKRFGIKTDDRRRHMYVIGKTGMGKSTLLENMVINDMWAGHGIGLIDPHGDLAEKILDFVPPHRVKDVVYFNPADVEFPLGFNILEHIDPDKRHLVASGLMGVFKKIWPDVWSARMEYILNNTILTLLECHQTTLISINRLLADKVYRRKAVVKITDPVVRAFWLTEFDKYSEKYMQEAIAPIQNKIGQFLSASIVRNIVAQKVSTFNVREIMDQKKIFIVNLSKGRIGEDASRLLGGMLITKIQLSAMERVDQPEEDRKDFFLYVDEFQNFATESFANILSEARKYRLSLVLANQFIKQLDEKVADAVFGNVGTLVTYRIGPDDAELFEREFSPVFLKEDVVDLPKFHIYLKLMIDGIASQPFSAEILPPSTNRTHSLAATVASSRKQYGTPRATIEAAVQAWSIGPAEEDFITTGAADATRAPELVFGQGAPAYAAAAPVPAGTHAFAPLPPPAPKKESNLPPPENWFPAVCGRCGKPTTVPFKPDGSRKIYCKDCYKFRHEDEAPVAVASVPAPISTQVAGTDAEPAKKKRRRRKKKSNSDSSGLVYDNPSEDR